MSSKRFSEMSDDEVRALAGVTTDPVVTLGGRLPDLAQECGDCGGV